MSLEITEALRSALGFNLDQNFFAGASTLEEIENALFKFSLEARMMHFQKKC